MAKLYNLARMTTATTGTGTITLGSAVSGYLTFALAGVSNADSVDYAIKDGANSEIGTGTYTSAGTTLTRSVTKSTNANAAISLSGTAEVFISPRAETLNDASVLTTGTLPAARLSFTTAEFNTALSDGNLATVATSGSASDLGSGTLPVGRLSFTTAEFNTALSDNNLATVATSGSAADLTGNLAVARLNSGTSASASTYWRGDGTWAAAGAPTEATAAEMETASGSTQMVTPRRILNSPYAAKVWIKSDNDTSIPASAGVSSLTDGGTSNWTINFSTAFSSVNYAYSFGFEDVTATGVAATIMVGTQSAGSMFIYYLDTITGTTVPADPTRWSAIMFGDQ